VPVLGHKVPSLASKQEICLQLQILGVASCRLFLLRKSLRKELFTSKWNNCQLLAKAWMMMSLMVIGLITEENVSLKLNPWAWWNPLATNRAFYLFVDPFAFSLTQTTLLLFYQKARELWLRNREGWSLDFEIQTLTWFAWDDYYSSGISFSVCKSGWRARLHLWLMTQVQEYFEHYDLVWDSSTRASSCWSSLEYAFNDWN